MLRPMVLLAILALPACLPANSAPLSLNSFEGEAAAGTLQTAQADAVAVSEHATDGKLALKATFNAADWPHVWFDLGKAYPTGDWRPYGAFVFDAYNPDSEPVTLCVRVDDDPRADGGQHCRQTGVSLPPRKPVTVSLAILPPNLFMRGGPPAASTADVSGDLGSSPLDLSRIVAFQFFMDHPKRPRTVYIDNVRLTEGSSLDGIVDRFGQYTRAEWPGKVHAEADLARRRAQEAKELRAAPRPPDRDEWGGWARGPKLRATGWFRTEKLRGKWWLVTPTGHLFWSVGLDCVSTYGDGPIKGRESLFTWLPEKGDPLYAFGGRGADTINFWGINVYRKYGPQWETPWLNMTRERMRVWGFNTIGNWSWDRSCRELRIPYTVAIHYGAAGFPGGWNDIPDVYADEWARNAEGAIRDVTGRWREDPYCIGYFVDNELSWGGWGQADGLRLPENALKLTGERAVKQQFTKLLRDKYADIAKLNAAWGTDLPSWEEFQARPVAAPPDKAAVRADLSLLLTDFAKRYFSVVSALMRQYAPHQLYLGPRFAVAPDECVLEAAKYCDVVSYNIYGRSPSILSRGEQIRKIDKPVLIGEFHFGALDRGMFHTGLGPVASQEERGIEYARYIQTALDQPWCVGAHWFTYGDEALTGRFDGENYNIGFVSGTDTPYPELVRHATKVNATIYKRRG